MTIYDDLFSNPNAGYNKVKNLPVDPLKGGEEQKREPKMPAWEVVLRVINPKSQRPRRMSLHTLATCIGSKDILALAKELEERKHTKVIAKARGANTVIGQPFVAGYRCPDVQCLIFYLDELSQHPGMIDTRNPNVWAEIKTFCEQNPYPKVQGFKRFAGGTWSGGSYGKGDFKPAYSAMDTPFEPDDYAYGEAIIKALKDYGYEPGIEMRDNKIVAKELVLS